jgi:[ribosomal protein S5]-alanine N-acetyltransferase
MSVGGPPEVITTPRLRLRPAALEDADAIYAGWARDPEVTRYLTWRPHEDVAITRAFLIDAAEAGLRGRRRLWAIETGDLGHLIGLIDAQLEPSRANLGWVLARAYWGRGYMSEAARIVTLALLAQRVIYRVWAVCDVDNPASARVMEKAGMTFEGRLRRWIVHPNVSALPRDVLCYARVR